MSGLNSPDLRVPKTIKLFIGGEFPRTESGRTLPVYTQDGKTLFAHLCRASRKDLRNAVTAALEAQNSWAGKTAYNRSQILYRMAEMTEGKRAEFGETLQETLGYDKKLANEAVDQAIDAFVYYAGFADKYAQVIGSVNPVAGPHHCFTAPEPVGVVGVLFDGELNLGDVVAQLAAILCSGNAMIALLPEKGAAILAPLAEVFATSDLPKGVVNLLTGSLSELATQFASHMEIQSLSYEGNDGKTRGELKALACGNMKRIAAKDLKQPRLSLDRVLSFVEYKTVWHPIGF
ncbi:aldehyde dehydrogenase family protein [Bdellovibrionota bacterium FG-1]